MGDTEACGRLGLLVGPTAGLPKEGGRNGLEASILCSIIYRCKADCLSVEEAKASEDGGNRCSRL
jgi:hypothetical protein